MLLNASREEGDCGSLSVDNGLWTWTFDLVAEYLRTSAYS